MKTCFYSWIFVHRIVSLINYRPQTTSSLNYLSWTIIRPKKICVSDCMVFKIRVGR